MFCLELGRAEWTLWEQLFALDLLGGQNKPATVLDNEVRDVDEAAPVLLAQFMLVIGFPNKMALLVGMNSRLIMADWIIDDVPRLQFWRNFFEIAGGVLALRGGVILFLIFILISISKFLIEHLRKYFPNRLTRGMQTYP
jgi:hypothetical protein